MLKNKLCKSIIAIIAAVVVFLPYVMQTGVLNPRAGDEYKIYAEEGDIRSYVNGEGTYFDARRSFYRDSAGQVVYCLQSGMPGASVSGTSGYVENQAEISSNKELMDSIKKITERGYPSRFDKYAVGGSDKAPVYKTGLMLDGGIYECTEGEARAATAFAIHRKMIEYGIDNPDAAIGNNETILSYRNGMSAVNDVIEIHERLLDDAEDGDAAIYMEWAVKKDDGSYEAVDTITPVEDDANGNMCVYLHITSACCYVNEIALFDADGYVNGAFVDGVEYISAFEKYVCIKIPKLSRNYDKAVGISCIAENGGAEPAKIMGNTNCQDIIVVPSAKDNIGTSLEGYLPGGSAYLYKRDYDTDEPIAGVVYGIYRDIACADKVMEITTDSAGCASAGELECGRYYLKEISCPAGYILDSEVHELDISPGMVCGLSLYNKRVSISVEVLKYDAENNSFVPQGDASLTGAVYGLYAREDIVHIDGRTGVIYSKDSQVGKITIGETGSGCMGNLYPGKYYLKELTPPAGYTLDKTEYEVDCTVDDSLATVIKKQVIVKEIPEKQAFQLVKFCGSEGAEQKPLEGAGFSAWLVSSLEIDKDGRYDFDSAEPYPIGKDGAVEMYTDNTGYACSAELPYGEYIVRETTVPDGFLRVEDFKVTVSEDSRAPQTLRLFNDEQVSARLKIIKTDSSTDKIITEPGYGFRIYDMTNKCYVKQEVTYPSKELLEVFKTNEEGYLILPEKLPAGSYRIEEVSVPEGSKYALNTNYIEFNISSDMVYKTDNNEAIVEVSYPNNLITGKLIIHKTYEQNNNADISTATDAYEPEAENEGKKTVFKLYSANNEALQNIEIDDEGCGYAEGLMPGSYYLVETSTLDGYVLEEKPIPFDIIAENHNNGSVVVELEIENRLTSVDFYKKDYLTGNIVSGATLILKDSSGNELDRWVSEDMPHNIKGLSLGEEYTLVEEFAPYGYLKAEDVIFTVGEYKAQGPEEEDCNPNAESVQEVIIYDKCPKGRITVNKYGDVISSVKLKGDMPDKNGTSEITFEEKALSDVEFALYAAEDIRYPDGSGKLVYPGGSMIATSVTDESGAAVFDGLMLGKYLLVETKSDSEHIVRPYSIPVTLEYIDQYTELVEAESSAWNERIESRIKINKVDVETGAVLKGAVFGLYSDEDICDGDGRLVFPKDSMIDCKISDEQGMAYFRNSLIPGAYYIKELTAPSGYILSDEKQYITILKSVDTELELCMENKRAGMVLGETGVSQIKEASQQVKTGDAFNPAVAVMLVAAIIGMLIISFCFYLRGR